MKASFVTAAFLLALGQIHAAPLRAPVAYTINISFKDTPEAEVIFQGADPDAYFKMEVPVDGSAIRITNSLSVSHIKTEPGIKCVFWGVDGSVTLVFGDHPVDVGPPQRLLHGSCNKM